MKHMSLAAVMLGGALWTACLAADTSTPPDLNGKEVVFWLDSPVSGRGGLKPRTATIQGSTIDFPLGDANEATVFTIYAEDQNDEALKQFFSGQVFQWDYNEGPPYLLPLPADKLQNKVVSARIYAAGSHNPSDYRTVTFKVEAGKIRFELDDDDGSVFVVIFGSDQHDDLIRKLLGKRIYGWVYERGREFSLPRRVRQANQTPWTLTFADSLGNIVMNAQASLYLVKRNRRMSTKQALVATGILDEQGQVTFPGRGRGHAWLQTGISTAGFRFVIHNPDYGTTFVEAEGYAPPQFLFLPSVPPDSEAAERCIWGTVVDTNGTVLSGATVTGIALIPMGGNWIRSLRGQRHGAVTDDQGRFRMYLIPEEGAFEVGIIVPPKTQYQVSIEPPPERHL
ncbi:MAG: carboxypeptidase-like regulatory domain-containing protein, partial [Planctomycetota bacterium]